MGIWVNLPKESNADLTYSPKKIFDIIPFVDVNGIRYVDPEYQFIDFYKSFVDPNNYYRWKDKKEYTRYLKLEYAYPIQKKDNPNISVSNDKYLKKIYQILEKNKNDVIFTGIWTYNRMMAFMKWKLLISEYMYDIYSKKPFDIAQQILKEIPELKIKYMSAFVDHLPESIVISYKDVVLLNIYDINNIYTPNVPVIKVGEYQSVSYHFLLLFLYVQLLKYRVLKNQKLLDLTYFMIYQIKIQRNVYLNENNFLGVDIGKEKGAPINIFNFNIKEKPQSFMEKMLTRRYLYFNPLLGYNPQKKIIPNNKIPDYQYPSIDYREIGLDYNANKITLAKNMQQKASQKNKFPVRDEKINKFVDIYADLLIKYNKIEYITNYDKMFKKLIESFICHSKYIVSNNIIFNLLDKKYLDYSIQKDEYKYVIYGNQQAKDKGKYFVDGLIKYIEKKGLKLLYPNLVQVDKYRYDIKYNFRTILTLIKLRDDVFDNLKYFELKSECQLRVLDPNLLKFNVYKVFTDSRFSLDLWEENLKTEERLYQLFPTKSEKYIIQKTLDTGIQDIIINYCRNKDIIIVGDYSINLLLENNRKTELLELLTPDIKKIFYELKNIFIRKYGANIDFRYQDQRSDIKLYQIRYSVTFNQKKILEMYETSGECLPYNMYKNQWKIGTYHLILRYLYIKLYETKDKKFESSIGDLMKNKKMLNLKEGLWKIFNLTCMGNQRDEMREFLEARAKGELKFIRYPDEKMKEILYFKK